MREETRAVRPVEPHIVPDVAISLDRLKVEYAGPNHDRVEATPAREVRYLRPPQRPGAIEGPAGKVKVLKTKKNPLDAWEIEGRAMSAQMLPPGQSASISTITDPVGRRTTDLALPTGTSSDELS